MVTTIYSPIGDILIYWELRLTQLCRLYFTRLLHCSKRSLLVIGILFSLGFAEGYLMQTQTRQVAAALTITAAALVGIASHESYRGSTYTDSGGVATLGYGETKGVTHGQTTTPERALQTLLVSADQHAKEMSACITVPIYQYEFDAYLSFTYNVGAGAFCRSTLNKKLNAGDYAGACNELLRWNRVGNKVIPGLTKRRQAEYLTCIGQK